MGDQLGGQLEAQLELDEPQAEATPSAKKLTPAERVVLVTLLDGSLSKGELATRMARPSTSGAFRRALAHLLTLEVIERTIPGRPNSRNQRYRLTRLGRTRAMAPDA